MKKQIQDMKFRVGSEQESMEIQKLLFVVGCTWSTNKQNISYTRYEFLFVKKNILRCSGIFETFYDFETGKETTLEELKSIVGEYLCGDILGCQVSILGGTAFVVGVKVCSDGEVMLILEAEFGMLPTYVSNGIEFFTNDYNDDTLLFEDFLKFTRSEEEENTND